MRAVLSVTLLALSCALLPATTKAHKVLLINDIHLDVNSTQHYSEPGTPLSMITLNKVLSEAADEEAKTGEPIEAILLMGDLCKHGMAVEINAKQNNWDLMKFTIKTAISAIETYFPTVPILPVLGNNDVVFHD
jgi:hypothetical protein